ncbi:hypothetical protein, partial [Vreelandella venusta]|uniref:hypothetical protein n=1 Tax=Vreelandella venusta TaxID=44935 RepID=UPI003C2E1726
MVLDKRRFLTVEYGADVYRHRPLVHSNKVLITPVLPAPLRIFQHAPPRGEGECRSLLCLSYSQIWWMAVRRQSCLIDRLPAPHPETGRC